MMAVEEDGFLVNQMWPIHLPLLCLEIIYISLIGQDMLSSRWRSSLVMKAESCYGILDSQWMFMCSTVRDNRSPLIPAITVASADVRSSVLLLQFLQEAVYVVV